MKIRITKTYDDALVGTVTLGTVDSKVNFPNGTETRVKELWREFQATRPDSDSDFIGFLVATDMFIEVNDDFMDVSVD